MFLPQSWALRSSWASGLQTSFVCMHGSQLAWLHHMFDVHNLWTFVHAYQIHLGLGFNSLLLFGSQWELCCWYLQEQEQGLNEDTSYYLPIQKLSLSSHCLWYCEMQTPSRANFLWGVGDLRVGVGNAKKLSGPGTCCISMDLCTWDCSKACWVAHTPEGSDISQQSCGTCLLGLENPFSLFPVD